MAYQWSLSSSTVSANNTSKPVYLSDGSYVFSTLSPSFTTLLVYRVSGHTTPTLIGSFAITSANQYAPCTLAVDSSDNIYGAQYGPSTALYFALANIGGPTGSWTLKGPTSISYGYGVNTGFMGCFWSNTGGGTSGKGHVILLLSSYGTGRAYIASLDAGAMLNGSLSAVASQVTGSYFGGTYASASANGGTSGVGWSDGGNGAGTPGWFTWSITSAGVLSTVPKAGTIGISNANGPAGITRISSTQWLAWGGSTGTSAFFYAQPMTTSALGTTQHISGGQAAYASFPLYGANATAYFFGSSAAGAASAQTIYEASMSVGSNTVSFGSYAATDTGAAPGGITINNPSPRVADISAGPFIDWIVQGSDGGLYGGYVSFASAPNAPTLTSPANAAYVDVSSGVTFAGTYNSTDGANQNAYALRVKTSGAGTYNYYNASTNSLQSTIVWNADSVAPGGSWSVTLPASVVSDGNVYNWSLASQEAGSSLQGPFASDFTFSAQAAPAVTVNAPSGLVTATTSPAVQWTTTPPAGALQTAYRVIVEHGAYASTPGSGTQDWDSTTVTSGAQQATVGVALLNGTTYRAFVQVTETGGQTSGWAYTTFTVSLDPPAIPTVAIAPGTDGGTGQPTLVVTVSGHDNLLSADDASFEASLGTTAAVTNCTVAQVATPSEDGSHSLQMSSTAAGAMSAATAAGLSGYPVIGGANYTIRSDYRAAATPQSVRTDVAWYTSAGTLISTSTGTAVTDTMSGWTTSSAVVAAPANAAFARLIHNALNTAAAAEKHDVDNAGILPGTATAWTRGGLVGATSIDIWCRTAASSTVADPQRPNPAGARLAAALTPNGAQQASWTDRAAASGCVYEYRAALTGSSITTQSAWTA